MKKYKIIKKGLGKEDIILAECKERRMIPYELEVLGFGDCKTKLDENGTKIYYKGKRNQVYVSYR